jgi:hypothetical protein
MEAKFSANDNNNFHQLGSNVEPLRSELGCFTLKHNLAEERTEYSNEPSQSCQLGNNRIRLVTIGRHQIEPLDLLAGIKYQTFIPYEQSNKTKGMLHWLSQPALSREVQDIRWGLNNNNMCLLFNNYYYVF